MDMEMARRDYLTEKELKLANDLDSLLLYYGVHEFPNSDFEDELFKQIKSIMIDNEITNYTIEWDTRGSKIIGRKGLFCISFQFVDRERITMNYYVGKDF